MVIQFEDATRDQLQTAYRWAGGQHFGSASFKGMVKFLERHGFKNLEVTDGYTKCNR